MTIAAPIERFLHAIINPSDNDTLGSLIDRIITDDEYDISMARTLADAIYGKYSDKFISTDDLKKVLTAIPANECQLEIWNTVPRFASEYAIADGEIVIRYALMYLHDAGRQTWVPFTRGIAKAVCANGKGRVETYTYDKDVDDAANLTFYNTSDDEIAIKSTFGPSASNIGWKTDVMSNMEVFFTTDTDVRVHSETVTIVPVKNNNLDTGDTVLSVTTDGHVVEAVMNMPVPQRAELLQYLDNQAKSFTFNGIIRRVLQRRIDTTPIDGLYKVVRGLKLKTDEEI